MARTALQEYTAIQREAYQDLTGLFARLSAQLRDVLLRETGPSGKVPITRLEAVQRNAGELVTALFLGRSGNAVAPFEVVQGRVMPLSPYASLVLRGMQRATEAAVSHHAGLMEQRLKDAPDVLAALRMAKRNPFEEARRVSELRRFPIRPFLVYDPAHLFVGPDGYRLSDRIWRTSADTRRKIDLILQDGIAQGTGSLDLADRLEVFLQPDRALNVTHKPYGTTASADAMRLARTEIAAAHSRAGMMSAYLNPFVQGVEVVRSTAGRECTTGICDEHAANGPYPLDKAPVLPAHPNCMCHYRWVMTRDTAAVIEDLRAELQQGARPAATSGDAISLLELIGPLMGVAFAALLWSPSAGAVA